MRPRLLPDGAEFGEWLAVPKGRVARLNRAEDHQRSAGTLGPARLDAMLEMVRDRPAYIAKFATLKRMVRMMLRDRHLSRDQMESLARSAGGSQETALRYLRDPRVDETILHRIFNRGDTWPNYLDALFDRVRWPTRVARVAGDCADHTRLQPHHMWKIRAVDPRTTPDHLAALLSHATLDLPVIRTIAARTTDRAHPEVRSGLHRKARIHDRVLHILLKSPTDGAEEADLVRIGLERHPDVVLRYLERTRRLPEGVALDDMMPLLQSETRWIRERATLLVPALRSSAVGESDKSRFPKRASVRR